jgi:hypothetical protein
LNVAWKKTPASSSAVLFILMSWFERN